jgi:phage shock protein E
MRRMTRTLVPIVLAAVALASCSSSGAVIETVDPGTAAEIIATEPSAVVLDIRTPDEFAQGTIEGAVNIDFYDTAFADQLDSLDKDAHYVVFCRSGNRSGQAMGTFADLGFTDVTEIDGGIVNWYQSGLPVTQG